MNPFICSFPELFYLTAAPKQDPENSHGLFSRITAVQFIT